jgi:predicted dehydrogenase
MDTQNNYQFIILGLGSSGKRHAEFLNGFQGELVCVDPSKEARDWAESTFHGSSNVFASLEGATEKIKNSSLKKVGVISNWGTLHYESTQALIGLGVINLYIEKPIANSLQAIGGLRKINSNVKLIGGFQNRYTKIFETVHKISKEKLGGPPSMMVINGGAAGMVTNGIHFLDLAISIFKSYPTSVISNLSSLNINPRSKDLDFWEGSAFWNFENNQLLTINFTNSSSVRQSSEIFCPNGKIKINEDMTIDIFERDKEEMLSDNRVIRLGTAIKTNQSPVKPEVKKLFERIFMPLFDESASVDRERELIATEAMIYALIANQMEKKLKIGADVGKQFYNLEWKIS